MPHLTPPVSACCLLRYLGYQELETDPHNTYQHVWVEPTPHPVEPQVEEPLPMTSTKPIPDVIALSDVAGRLQKAFARKAEEEARAPLAAVEALHDDLVAGDQLLEARGFQRLATFRAILE